MLFESIPETLVWFVQHRVKYCHRNPMFSQESGRIQSAKWRIGLHFPRLLAVVVQVIRMCQQHVNHGHSPLRSEEKPLNRLPAYLPSISDLSAATGAQPLFPRLAMPTVPRGRSSCFYGCANVWEPPGRFAPRVAATVSSCLLFGVGCLAGSTQDSDASVGALLLATKEAHCVPRRESPTPPGTSARVHPAL